MRTAAHCGLGVAEVIFEPTTRACLVKRFDRVAGENDPIARLRQYDFCQLSGITSGKKYESDGRPGMAKCAELIRAHSSQPRIDQMRFLQWIFFNLYTGNNDSHAKNLSLYELPGQGWRLTPFYDLMDTRLYPGLSTRFALRIGGEDEPGKIARVHLFAMAAEMNLKPTFILDLATSIHARIDPAVQLAMFEIEPSLDHSGKALAGKLLQHLTSIANKNAARFG